MLLRRPSAHHGGGARFDAELFVDPLEVLLDGARPRAEDGCDISVGLAGCDPFGNISANPHVGLLFIDFQATQRLRVNGQASLHLEDPLKAEYPGAQAIVRVRAEHIFPNCPRYIHRMQLVEASPYVPLAGCAAPVPGWKQNPAFKDCLPRNA